MVRPARRTFRRLRSECATSTPELASGAWAG
jgi:hypothetical protein